MAVVSKSNFLRNKDGFTLPELILVIVIIGILAGLAFPQASNIISKHRLESAAKELVSDMRMVQQMAISKEMQMQLIFRHKGSSLPSSYSFKPYPYTSTFKAGKLSNNVDLIEAVFGSQESNKFVFGKLGTPNLSGHIKISNKNGQSLWIVIYKTGRIRISETRP